MSAYVDLLNDQFSDCEKHGHIYGLFTTYGDEQSGFIFSIDELREMYLHERQIEVFHFCPICGKRLRPKDMTEDEFLKLIGI